MESGRLRNIVTVEKPRYITDDSGMQSVTWDSVGLAYCSIMPIGATESLLGQQVRSTITHNIMMRYSSAITAACRLNWTSQGRIFEIVEIKQDATFGRDMLIKAMEIVKNA